MNPTARSSMHELNNPKYYPPPSVSPPTSHRSRKSKYKSKQRDSRSRQYHHRRQHQIESSENSSDDEDDDDFFTGESDNDFVSLSSGSNSKKVPRRSWTCEHCTYVNNPGVSVCVMCCRTSKQSRGENSTSEVSDNDQPPPIPPPPEDKKKKKEILKKKAIKNKEYSDEDCDIDAYYAVRSKNGKYQHDDVEGIIIYFDRETLKF